MNIVPKAAAALLTVSWLSGQTWLHEPATPRQIAQMTALRRACPEINVPARHDSAISQFDVIKLRDAYYRARITKAIYSLTNTRSGTCM